MSDLLRWGHGFKWLTCVSQLATNRTVSCDNDNFPWSFIYETNIFSTISPIFDGYRNVHYLQAESKAFYGGIPHYTQETVTN